MKKPAPWSIAAGRLLATSQHAAALSEYARASAHQVAEERPQGMHEGRVHTRQCAERAIREIDEALLYLRRVRADLVSLC